MIFVESNPQVGLGAFEALLDKYSEDRTGRVGPESGRLAMVLFPVLGMTETLSWVGVIYRVRTPLTIIKYVFPNHHKTMVLYYLGLCAS